MGWKLNISSPCALKKCRTLAWWVSTWESAELSQPNPHRAVDPWTPWTFPRLPLLRRYLRACESLVAETLPELCLGEIQSWGGDLIVESMYSKGTFFGD